MAWYRSGGGGSGIDTESHGNVTWKTSDSLEVGNPIYKSEKTYATDAAVMTTDEVVVLFEDLRLNNGTPFLLLVTSPKGGKSPAYFKAMIFPMSGDGKEVVKTVTLSNQKYRYYASWQDRSSGCSVVLEKTNNHIYFMFVHRPSGASDMSGTVYALSLEYDLSVDDLNDIELAISTPYVEYTDLIYQPILAKRGRFVACTIKYDDNSGKYAAKIFTKNDVTGKMLYGRTTYSSGVGRYAIQDASNENNLLFFPYYSATLQWVTYDPDYNDGTGRIVIEDATKGQKSFGNSCHPMFIQDFGEPKESSGDLIDYFHIRDNYYGFPYVKSDDKYITICIRSIDFENKIHTIIKNTTKSEMGVSSGWTTQNLTGRFVEVLQPNLFMIQWADGDTYPNKRRLFSFDDDFNVVLRDEIFDFSAFSPSGNNTSIIKKINSKTFASMYADANGYAVFNIGKFNDDYTDIQIETRTAKPSDGSLNKPGTGINETIIHKVIKVDDTYIVVYAWRYQVNSSYDNYNTGVIAFAKTQEDSYAFRNDSVVVNQRITDFSRIRFNDDDLSLTHLADTKYLVRNRLKLGDYGEFCGIAANPAEKYDYVQIVEFPSSVEEPTE